MTLIIAADTQDHIILSGDHRAIIRCEPWTNLPSKIVIDNYRKIKLWRYGAIAVSGHVILMDYFFKLLVHHEKNNKVIDLIKIAKDAKYLRAYEEKSWTISTGSAFFSIVYQNKINLVHLSIRNDTIEYEVIDAMSVHFSMGGGSPDDPIYQEFSSYLRPSECFQGIEQFYQHHIDLFKWFHLRQHAFDDSITVSFDIFIQNKKTGEWHLKTITDHLGMQ